MRGVELRFKLVAVGHQFGYFGDDPILFGEGWKWERYPSEIPQAKPYERHAVMMRSSKFLADRGIEVVQRKAR